MKTRNEILVDAQRIEALGRQLGDHYRGVIGDGAESLHASRVLVRYPESRFTGVDVVRTRERWIEARVVDGVVNYQLREVERKMNVSGVFVHDHGPAVLMASASAFDVLNDAEERTENERLGEALAPFMAQKENDSAESTNPTIVKEIEGVVGAGDLPPSLRIRTKAEIVDFLAGRLTPSEFITNAIQRQRWREEVRELRFERMVIGMGGSGE